MSASMILVLLVVAAISARIMRSTKMWWIFLFTIMTGLLVGMLSKETVNHFVKKEVTASIAPLTNTVDNVDLLCMLPVVTVTEGATHGVTGYAIDLVEQLSDALVGNHTTKGRDSPEFEDDS